MKQSARTASYLLFSLALLMAGIVVFLTYHVSDGVPLPLLPGTYRTDMTLADQVKANTTKIVYFTFAAFMFYFMGRCLQRTGGIPWSILIKLGLLVLVGLLVLTPSLLIDLLMMLGCAATFCKLVMPAPLFRRNTDSKSKQKRTNFFTL